MRRLYLSLVVLLVSAAPGLGRADEQGICDGALSAQKAGDLEKAITAYSSCLSDGQLGTPDEIIAHYNRGRAYAAIGKDWDAIQDFTAVVQLQPNNADALYARGVLYQAGGDLNFAIQDFSTAIKYDENYYQAYSARGIAYAEKGDKDFALQDLNQAVALDQLAPSSYNDRGFFYLSEGNDKDALKDFDEAIKLKPDFPLALENRGHLNFFEGRYGEAAKNFEAALKVNGKDAYAAIWLYLSQARTGDKGALKQLQKNAAALDLETWPGPVVSLFLGKTAPDALAGIVAGGRGHDGKVKQAEGNFYLGEQRLLQGDKAAAKANFEAATQSGLNLEIETIAARAELKRL